MTDQTLTRVLFVCTGNICRSPTAEGVFRDRVRRAGVDNSYETDSVGTHGYHVGSPPDRRAQTAARNRGYEIGDLRARQLNNSDFEYFDYILVMDHGHLEIALAESPAAHRHKIHLFLKFARNHDEEEVPDPYYGGAQGFEHVLDLIEDASDGLLEHTRQRSR